ncbi:MAG TPA: SGNH/GDSL hydrolase family protein [Steroidobacteraceae bacterium]|nr:SGNH/GDSL hydrolase family protein [Steroidobacteraceae bacterium]
MLATVTLIAGLLGAMPASAEDAELERLRTDWAQLRQYRDENQRLPPPSAARPRIVFLGDSLTQGWDLTGLGLDEVELVNRGISGQTTPQMLIRFRQDVVSLKPAVVHILAGTNDLAGNTGPTTLEAIEANLSSMVEIARANHIRVVLSSVLPALDYPWRPGLEPAPRIVALNDWIRAYARQRKLVYADYYPALVDSRGGFRTEMADDGVHPNAAGYAAMSPIARQAVKRALAAH